MKSLSMNANRDLYVGDNGNLAIVSGVEQSSQRCEQAMRLVYGELILDADRGLPYNLIIGKSISSDDFNYYATRELTAVEGVNSIVSVDNEILDGVLQYNVVVLTDEGLASASSSIVTGAM